MSSLVDEILSFSKASLGHVSSKMGVHSLQAILEKCVQREAAEKTSLVIPTGTEVVGDAQLLERAFGNILRNARRYVSKN